MAKRIAFLESKGLTQAEISEAVARTTTTVAGTLSNDSGAIVGGASVAPLPPAPDYRVGYAPAPPQRDWRDYTLALIGAIGFGVGAFHLFQVISSCFDQQTVDSCRKHGQNYVLPNLSWPESAEQKQDRERLESQISSISTALEQATKSIQDQTEKLQQVMDSNTQEQEKNAQEVRFVRDELEGLKQNLP
ncbi:peroxisomal membrane protein pex14, partial [Physocladia obscura]